MGRSTRRIAYALQVLLGLLFAFSATMKLTGNMDEVRDLLGVVPWFWSLAGICQALGAVGLLAGLRSARLALAGAILPAGTMAGAVVIHVLHGDTLAEMTTAVALLVLLSIVAGLRLPDARLTDLLPAAGRPQSTSQAVTR